MRIFEKPNNLVALIETGVDIDKIFSGGDEDGKTIKSGPNVLQGRVHA
jgi:hypothetical protein